MVISGALPMSEREEIAALKACIVILEEQLRLAAVKQFAPKSEKHSTLAPIDLFNAAEHLGGASDAHAASARDATEIEVPAHKRDRGKRKPIDATLPRLRDEHDIPDDQKTCSCGCQLTRIGEVASEHFDLIPARAQVLLHVRFKYACRACEDSSHDGPAVVTADMPAQPLPKSNVSPALAAFITVSKFVTPEACFQHDGLPLYRQEGILERYRTRYRARPWPSG